MVAVVLLLAVVVAVPLLSLVLLVVVEPRVVLVLLLAVLAVVLTLLLLLVTVAHRYLVSSPGLSWPLWSQRPERALLGLLCAGRQRGIRAERPVGRWRS